jgi:hypothetical protein
MDENQFEDIIVKYPEMIEDGLKLMGRQIFLYDTGRNYIDILFKDQSGYHLIIELKIGPIIMSHIDQIKKYEKIYQSLRLVRPRIMLAGNMITQTMIQRLKREHVGYKVIKVSEIKVFLKKRGDFAFLRYFEQHEKHKREKKIIGKKLPRKERVGVLTGRNIWGSRGGTMQNRFCNFVIKSGENGVSMEEAKNASWNPRHYHFNETVERLKKRGYITERKSKYYVTQIGLDSIYE